jgi:hypothetical protein
VLNVNFFLLIICSYITCIMHPCFLLFENNFVQNTYLKFIIYKVKDTFEQEAWKCEFYQFQFMLFFSSSISKSSLVLRKNGAHLIWKKNISKNKIHNQIMSVLNMQKDFWKIINFYQTFDHWNFVMHVVNGNKINFES